MAIKKNLSVDAKKQRLTLGMGGKVHHNETSEPSLFNSHHDGAEIDEDTSFTVGERLRHEREKKGHSLHEMAEILRLRPRQIQALEDGVYDNLPGQAFVVGFLRSYANVLGLDAVAIVDLYKHEHAGQIAAPQLAFPEPTSEGRLPGSGLLIGTCLAAALAFGGWYFYQNENKGYVENVPDLPNRLTARLLTETEKSNESQQAAVSPSVNDRSEAPLAGSNGSFDESAAVQLDKSIPIAANEADRSLDQDNSENESETIPAVETAAIPTENVADNKSALNVNTNPENLTDHQPLGNEGRSATTEKLDMLSAVNGENSGQLERDLSGAPSILQNQSDGMDKNTEIAKIEESNADTSSLSVKTDEMESGQQSQTKLSDQPVDVGDDVTDAETSKTTILEASTQSDKPVDPLTSEQPKLPASAIKTPTVVDEKPVFKQETLTAQFSQTTEQGEQIAGVAAGVEESDPESFGIQNTNARIILKAHQEVWVQIVGDEKNIVLERMFNPGDTFMVPALDDLKLTTANAAGLEIRLDGEVLSSLGGFGAIVRNLDLDPLRLKEQFTVTQ